MHAVPAGPDAEDLQLHLFREYLAYQEETGYDGSFEDFVFRGDPTGQVQQEIDEQVEAALAADTSEHILPRDEGGFPTLSATVDNVEGDGHPLYTVIGKTGEEEFHVQGAEHLLAALEMMGVENARIEIEGGNEVPIVDGSAQGWAIEIHTAGVRRATGPEGSDTGVIARVHPEVSEPFTVMGSDGAYISFVPGDKVELTAGVDHYDVAPIIGRQWYTYDTTHPEGENHPRWQWLNARGYSPTTDALIEARRAGFYKGGTSDCTVVAFGTTWFDPGKVRWFDDEPSRHRMTDLAGDLSLMAADGNSGLPKGHVIAWKADHQLNLKFARALAARMQWPEIPIIEVPEPSEEADEDDPDAETDKEQITRSEKPTGMRKKRMYEEAAGPKVTFGDPYDSE